MRSGARPSRSLSSSLPQDVYGRLRALIVAGRIAPGTRLVETMVASRLAVSRTPVREAIRRLAHEGLAQEVRVGAKTKIAVAPATIADLVDLFGIIGALEGVAGRGITGLSAAARRTLAGELATLNDRFGRLAKSRPRDPEPFFETHDAFHTTLVEGAATERLRGLIAGVRPQVKRYELLYSTAVGSDFSDSVREHRHVITAVRSGTADQLERAVRLNWSNSAKRLSAGLASAAVGSLTYDTAGLG